MPPAVDALVTTTRRAWRWPCWSPTASRCCWPTRGAGVVAAVHAGRPGMAAGVVPHAVAAMRDLGARTVVRGGRAVGLRPLLRGARSTCASSVAAAAPASRAVWWTGTPALDVAAGVVAPARRRAVSRSSWVPGCTREDDRLFSYRRDGRTGRYAGVVVRAPLPGTER